MSSKIAFVSSADSNYFELLHEWVQSVKSFPQSKDFDVLVFNSGMTEAELHILKEEGVIVKEINWPFAIPKAKIQGREFLKACLARPFIPEIFPGYDYYFWMDCDTWIQKWNAIDAFIEGAKKGHIALTGQVDRAFPKQVRIKWFGRMPLKVRGFYFSNARKAFGYKTAKFLLPYPVLLAGAFCLKANAPHWKHWQGLVEKAANAGNPFTAEQTSLGKMCYMDGLPFQLLPSYFHWPMQATPMWDQDNKLFVEPFVPHEPIGILHLTGVDHMRASREETTKLETLSGEEVNLPYRYPNAK